MDKGWNKTTLGECAIINADTYSPKEGWPFINYLETGQITDNIISDIHYLTTSEDKIPASARRKIRKGDIVYSTVRPNKNHFGIIKVLPDNLLVSTAFAVIRGKPYLADTSFIYYYLTQKSIINFFHTLAEHSSSAYPSLQMNDIETFEIILPPIKEQQAIAHILESLDDKIELNRRMNKTLEEMARVLFKSWFVDFDPVRAKMDGRWKPGESLPGLPAELYDLFSDRLIPSELGEMPRGWQESNLGEIVETVRGRSYRSADLNESNTALVSLKSFARGGGYRTDGLKPYTGPYKPQQVVQPGEIVIAMTDVTQAAEVVGRPAIVKSDRRFETLVASLDALIIRPQYPNISVPYLYCLAQTPLFQHHMVARATGTTVLHLSRDAVPTFPIYIPPNSLLKVFNDITIPIYKRIDISVRESANLKQLRDNLLPKLVSGEIRVDELDIEL